MTTNNLTTEQFLNDIVKEIGITKIILDMKYEMEHRDQMTKVCNQINPIDYSIIGYMRDISRRDNNNRWIKYHNTSEGFEVFTSDQKWVTMMAYNRRIENGHYIIDNYLHHIDDYPEGFLQDNPYYQLYEDELYIEKRQMYII